MIYLVVVFILTVLSFRYDINGKTKYRDFWYNVMLVVFIMIAGLRYRIGIDTVGYIRTYYHSTPLLASFFNMDYSFAQYPLWKFLNSFFYTVGAPFYVLQLVTAAFVNILFFFYIRKHCDCIFTCILFYFLFFYSSVNFETTKASYSIAIFLFANDCFLEKKWVKGYVLYLIATLFHPSTIALFIVPLLLFLRFNLWGMMLLLITFVGGFILQKSFGDFIMFFDVIENDTISDKIEGYSESDRYGSSLGLMSIIKNIPIIIYSFISVKNAFKCNCHNRLLVLEPFLMLAMLLLVLQFNIFIFYRFYQFFFIYVCLFLSQLFVDTAKCRKFQRSFSYIRVLILFLPLFLIMTWKYKRSYMRYYPYATVIEKNIDKEREKLYNNMNSRNMARFDEY